MSVATLPLPMLSWRPQPTPLLYSTLNLPYKIVNFGK